MTPTTRTRTRTRTRFLALKTHHHPWIMLFSLLVFQNCSLFSFPITSVNALGCECTGDEFLVSGVSLGRRCAEWGDKNAICADQTTVTDECCKPWCWVSQTDCPSARYNKQADKYFSYDACGATCANDHCGEEKTYVDTRGAIVCESEYQNTWVRYRMSSWIFIIPLFCLFSSLRYQQSRRRMLLCQNQLQGGGSPYGQASAGVWRGQNFGLQNNFTTPQGQAVYIVGANGRLTPLQNSNAANQPQFYQGGNPAQEVRRQQNQPRSGGMLDALFGRANRGGGGGGVQSQQQPRAAAATSVVPEMSPESREPAYAPPSNYYGNENQARRNQAVTDNSPQQAYPTV